MLNLVQVQERLKDVPMQALMQYANGGNPQVPPFLALGELNRRKKMQEGAAAEQAQAMEGAPTVKQQIEQAAGLMALQGNRQKQAAQQQQGIQAAMPMAAPNTTTSEPAQLAGGGAIDDIVVPRDYAPGGMVGGFDPEKLKQEMFKEAMQGDVADIPKELIAAVRKAALRGAPGISSLPLPKDMFKRGDYAGGGIVAFNGEKDSYVESSPGFYQLKEEMPEEDKNRLEMSKLPIEIRQLIELSQRAKERMSPEAVLARRKAAGLPTLASEMPDTGAKTLAELQRQQQELAESDTFANRLLSLTPGRRFGTGETGKGLVAYEKDRMAKANEVNRAIATAQDLREKAKMDFAENRFNEGEKAMAAADKLEMDILGKIPEAIYKSKLGAQAEHGKVTNFSQLMEIIDEAKKNPTPENIRRMNSAITAAGYVTYAAPRVEATERGTTAANERAAVDKYQELFEPRKMLMGPLSDDMDAAAARDKKEGTGTRYQDQIRLREYNRIREGLSLPPASRLPGTAPSGSAGPAKTPPPPPGFVPQR